MEPWVQALLWGAIGLVIYLILLKRLRRTHRPDDVPDVVLPADESGTTSDHDTDTTNPPREH